MLVAGYIRVSKEREGQISPDSQRSEILAYCERKGWTVAEFFEDLDISGRTDRRPGLQEMLRRAQDGEFQAVVLYRIDRLSREPMHHYAILAALKEAGVLVDSVGMPSDGTPENAFLWDLSAALAKLESLRLGKRLRSMHAELARQGKYGGNQPPFGWRRVRDPDGQQRLVLEPEEAEWRRRMHQWLQHGWTYRAISQELNRQGVRTRRGSEWTGTAVRLMLGRPMQVGVRVVAGQEYDGGRIEPLIDRETYARTLAIIEGRRSGPLPGRPAARPIPAGILICGACGGRLYAQRTARSSREGSVLYYACGSKARGGLCRRGPHIRETVLRGYVEPLLLKRLRQLALRAPREKPLPDLAPLRTEQEAIEVSLARLAALYSEGGLPEAEYRRAAEMQRRKLGQVMGRLEKATKRVEAGLLHEAIGGARLTPELWELLPVEAQQEFYRLAIERIVVNPQPTDERIEVVWR